MTAASSAVAPDDDALMARAREALRRATTYLSDISTEGGWLWSYSLDLRDRRGERPAPPTEVWVQPPGTPTVGETLLEAWRVTGDRLHLEAAERAGEALARGQLASGGWDYSIDFAPEASAKVYRRSDIGRLAPSDATRRFNRSTLDDDTTTAALRFLLELTLEPVVVSPARRAEIRSAFEHGRRALLAAQYPNGAWPQRFEGPAPSTNTAPIRPARFPESVGQHPGNRYYGYYTLNDHVHANAMRTLLAIWRATGDAECLAAARRAGEFLILAQLPAPQPVWAQQYNLEMEPAWARAFEPPAVCTAESVGAIRALMRLHEATGDDHFLAPIPAAIAWFERSAISSNRWARFYELRTNRPIYGDRDGRIHYTLAELSEERRTGYGWEGDFGISALLKEWRAFGAQPDAARLNRPPSPRPDPRARAAALAAVQSQDDHGRWLVNGRVETQEFCRRMRDIGRWLIAVAPRHSPAPASREVSSPRP